MTKISFPRRPSPPPAPEAEELRAVVSRRLAFRLGVSLPVAATIASLAGLGPTVRR